MLSLKKILVVVLTFFLTLSFFSCSKAKKDDKIVLGYTFRSSQDVFQNLLKNEIVKAAEARGAEVKVIDPQFDIEKQLAAVEIFITQQVDLILCNALDYEGIIPAIKNANDAGIPFVAVGSSAGGGDFVFVGSRHYDSGFIEGEYMAKVLPKNAKIVYLAGTPGMDHAVERRRGIQDALLNKRSDLKLLAEQAGNYDRALGMKIMEDWIQAFPHIDGVIAANDEMSLGALEALKAANRADTVLMAGIDGTTEAKQYVKKGMFAITVLQDAKAQAKAAIDAALDILAGKQVEKEIFVPYKAITKENIDEYM